MKNFSDPDEISLYRIGHINAKGEIAYNGSVKFSFSPLPTGFKVEIDSDTCSDSYNNSFELKTVFDKAACIKDMLVEGTFNNNKYQLTCSSSKKKLNFCFKSLGQEKNHSQSVPDKYIESNSLMFLLIPLLNNKKTMSLDVLNPTTASITKAHVSKIEALDSFKLNLKEFSCDRYKITLEGVSSQPQFFLYCKESGRLLKAICNNVIFEIQEIIK